MVFGRNLQYLRRLNGGMTQEQLAEKLNVSRQTISKWESGDVYPEVRKLMEVCEVFSCTMDKLLRDDMNAWQDDYSPVTVKRVEGFRMARYVIISPNPEDDVKHYMEAWAARSGLAAVAGEALTMIGWDFPFVSAEQQSRFGLRGYAAACLLPDGFEPACCGAELASQNAADYAVLTIRKPFTAAFNKIPGGYQRILAYLKENGRPHRSREGVLSCFERVYQQDGVDYMDVYVLCGDK